MICDLPVDSVDLASGNHRDTVKLNPTDWLVLTYPYSGPEMPGIVCLGQDADEYVPPEQRALQLKRGITIVNVAKLDRLIGLLRKHPFSVD